MICEAAGVALAEVIAFRKEPLPVSPVVVTIKVVAVAIFTITLNSIKKYIFLIINYLVMINFILSLYILSEEISIK